MLYKKLVLNTNLISILIKYLIDFIIRHFCVNFYQPLFFKILKPCDFERIEALMAMHSSDTIFHC